jgi:hypothetical protein
MKLHAATLLGVLVTVQLVHAIPAVRFPTLGTFASRISGRPGVGNLSGSMASNLTQLSEWRHTMVRLTTPRKCMRDRLDVVRGSERGRSGVTVGATRL